MHSLKYTIFNSYDNNKPLLVSIHFIKSYDPKVGKEIGLKISKYTYFIDANNFETKDIIQNKVVDDINTLFEKFESLNLKDLKNNYYTDTVEARTSHWELEYDMFKVVGTFDKIPKKIKQIETLIDLEKFIDECRNEEER